VVQFPGSTIDINKLILNAVRRLRTTMGRSGKAGRKKKRGRKGAKAKAAAKRRGLTVKEKANFVFKHRYLVTKRRVNLTEAEREDLRRMLQYLPALASLRRLADRVYWVFDTPKDWHQASCRRAALSDDPEFQAVAELVKAMKQRDKVRFPKLMAYLKNPASGRVRTNIHGERTNRMFRLLEKVRYKWRGRRTLVRFVVLTLDGIWREWTPGQTTTSESPNQHEGGRSQPQSGQQSRRVA
jgi:hypothetical protein